eukprot:g2823.t1
MYDRLTGLAMREFLGFTIFALALKAVLDVVVWRYAGPISLVIVLICVLVYLTRRNEGLSRLGFLPFKSAKSYWLVPAQTVLAFVAIIATGAAVTLIGDASGLAFMEADRDGATARFGDLAGNTNLFLFWLVILWIAGPAEELFFRAFMINTLTKALGKSAIANALCILIPAFIFGAGHVYYQVITIGKFIAALAAILIGSLSVLCHHERLYTASAATIVAITIIGGFVASLSNGGADGFVAPIMISAPVTAAVFIGARATLISAVAVVLAIISLLYLENLGWVTEAPYSSETLDIAAIVMLSAATGICATGVGYFAHAMQKQIGSLRESQDKLLSATEQLDHSAHHDPLTALANRQGLHRFLEQVFSSTSDTDHTIFLAHIDLDKFKSINDTHGHPVGDAVLINTAQIMRDEFGEGSIVARVGGDEFVIVTLLANPVDPSEAQALSDRLVGLLNAPMVANGIHCQVGASIGFVTAAPNACSIDTLMTDADLALYEAKRDGRGTARAFTPLLREALERDRVFRIEIEDALETGRVTCVLQPQINLTTGQVIGMEGLGRIEDKGGALLMPGMILPILTEMGRLVDFDHQVMCRSLDALVSLRETGLDIPYVSINASAQSLRSKDYTTRLSEALDARHLCPDDVIVEILESTRIESSDDPAAKCIDALRELGIKTIMDDFGSGHATISNLLKLDLDGLKIDRSLIADLQNKKTLKLVQAVHGLAREFDLEVIIEGVETPEQFARLKQIGCEMIQGFGICKPLKQSDFEAWMKDYGRPKIDGLQRQIRNLA